MFWNNFPIVDQIEADRKLIQRPSLDLIRARRALSDWIDSISFRSWTLFVFSLLGKLKPFCSNEAGNFGKYSEYIHNFGTQNLCREF